MQYPRYLLAITLLGAAPVAALHAQSDAAERARRERSSQIEVKIERLHREIEALVRRRMDAEQLRSTAEVDSAARELEPQIARASRRLAELQSALARQNVEQAMREQRERGAELRAAASAAQAEWRAQWEAQRAAGFAQQWPAPAPAPMPKMRQPSGWVGISYSGQTQMWYDSTKGLVLYHEDYPVILSVEPGSPAERAGIEAGDTVLAYDGRDVRRRQIPLARQLRPGARLVVRVRRDGRTRDLAVAVERRPASFAPTYAVVAPPAPPAPPAAEMEMMIPRTPRPEVGSVPTDVRHLMIVPPTSAPVAPAAPAAPAAPVAVPSTITVFTGTPAVAGAEVARMTAGLRDVFEVDGGVLVLSVAAGSPAAASGLRSGDVILRVNGSEVSSPLALQRAVQQCRDRAARLEIVRKKKNERLTLRW